MLIYKQVPFTGNYYAKMRCIAVTVFMKSGKPFTRKGKNRAFIPVRYIFRQYKSRVCIFLRSPLSCKHCLSMCSHWCDVWSLYIKNCIMATHPQTPGPLREDDLQPDDVIGGKQQPVPPKGNQDEQSRQDDEDESDDLLNEEDDDAAIDELLEEEKITDEDVDENSLEEDDAEKGPLK